MLYVRAEIIYFLWLTITLINDIMSNPTNEPVGSIQTRVILP